MRLKPTIGDANLSQLKNMLVCPHVLNLQPFIQFEGKTVQLGF